MTALQAYLQNSKARKVLSKKPGEAGFSLIELVVVVAVLAILAAIAIPAFTSINDKARAAAAASTVAQVAKECAVKYANSETSPTFAPVKLDGYTSFQSSSGAGDADAIADGSTVNCRETGRLIASSSDLAKYPTLRYNFGTGIKTCAKTGTADLQNCKGTSTTVASW